MSLGNSILNIRMVSQARAPLSYSASIVVCLFTGLMYQAFIIPLFDYCGVVWTPCLAKQVKAMEWIHLKVTSTVQHLMRDIFMFSYS